MRILLSSRKFGQHLPNMIREDKALDERLCGSQNLDFLDKIFVA
jgi:hypothetical protein